MNMTTILAIGAGGFIGALLRAYINEQSALHLSSTLPYGTLIVNVVGSLIIGILFALFIQTEWFSPSVKLFLTTGLMGALTTYSTFAMESVLLFNQSVFIALTNIFLNLFGSIASAAIGYYLTLKIST